VPLHAGADMSSKPELLTALLDEQLDEHEAAEVADYLERSNEARAELDSLRRMLKMVGDLPAVEAPPDFYDKVRAKLRRRKDGAVEGWLIALVSMPFQVLSIVVILVIAATYLMLELDQDRRRLEKDPSAVPAEEPSEPRE
jgi:anti-sigma factor RsiW